MAKFQVSGPDGAKYELDAPDESSALSAFQQFSGTAPAAPAEAAPAPIGDNRAGMVANLRGIPIAGAYADKATAYLNAVPGLAAPDSGMSTAPNFLDRAAENEKKITPAVDAYEKAHPVETGVGKFAAGAAALAPLGALAPVAKAIGLTGDALMPMMARGAVSGAGLAATDAKLRGEDPGRAAMFGAGAGLAGPAIGRGVGAAAEALANRAAVPTATDELAQAAARQGVDLPRVAATDNLSVQRLGAGLKEIPVVGTPIVKAAKQASEQMGDALQNVEAGFGSGSTLNAGDSAKTALTDWITGKSGDIAKRLYQGVDTLVDPAVTRDLSATRNMVADIAQRRQQAGLSGGGKAVDTVLEAVQRPGGLNYEGIKTLRTSVGEMLDNSLLPADVSKTELKRVYGALTADLKDTVATAGGPDAAKAFNRANTMNVMINQRREALAKIVGETGDAAPERVMDRLVGYASGNSRADFQRLLQARRAIGAPNWNEVASAAVSRLGRDPQGSFSPDRFLTSWGKLSQNGKQALFGSTGKTDLLGSLEDIYTLSKKATELNRLGNPSGTGRVLSGLSIGGSLLHSPHIALPGALGARLLASHLAKPLGLRAATLRTAQQNKELAALIQHVTGVAVTGEGLTAIPAMQSQPSQVPIQ